VSRAGLIIEHQMQSWCRTSLQLVHPGPVWLTCTHTPKTKLICKKVVNIYDREEKLLKDTFWIMFVYILFHLEIFCLFTASPIIRLRIFILKWCLSLSSSAPRNLGIGLPLNNYITSPTQEGDFLVRKSWRSISSLLFSQSQIYWSALCSDLEVWGRKNK
jgi:hypothetical protein